MLCPAALLRRVSKRVVMAGGQDIVQNGLIVQMDGSVLSEIGKIMQAYTGESSFQIFIPAAFLFGLLALGVLVAILAFRNETKTRQTREAARKTMDSMNEYRERSEQRAIVSAKQAEEHYGRVEAPLKEISDKLGKP